MRHTWLVAGVVLCVGAAAAFGQATATFQALGNFPGYTGSSEGYGVSTDGTTVVGYGNAAGQVSFRWTAAGGMENLDGTSSAAYAASADGAVVVGGSGGLAYRWTGGTMTSLGDLPGGAVYSLAYDVSDDGATVVGSSNSTAGSEAFVWTAEGGIVGLGDLAGGLFTSVAYAVAADGSTVAGYSVSASGTEACRWTRDGGGTWVIEGLGDLEGGSFYGIAYGASADGSIIVGQSSSTAGYEAFLWTAEGGMVSLGDIEGDGVNARARAVSADGQIVVGRGRSATGYEASIWTPEGGMQRLQDYLATEFGITLPAGWVLLEAFGISADGSTIVGSARDPGGYTQAWIVKIARDVPPEANPGGPYVAGATSWSGASVMLDGSASSDPDNPEPDAITAYEWDLNLTYDSDGDGDPTNDVDATGPTPTAQFPIGQTDIALVVVDQDDLRSAPAVTTVTVSTIEVEIDIRPGDDTNTINLGSHGAIPVAFLTTPDFDASTIDPTTVTLRGEDFSDGLVKLRGKKQMPMADLTDVDGDGDLDLAVSLQDRVVIASNDLPRAPRCGCVTVRVQARKGLVGAVVRVLDPKGRPLGLRELNGAESCGGQAAPVAHFGLPVGQVRLSVCLSDGRVAQQTLDVQPTHTPVTVREAQFK